MNQKALRQTASQILAATINELFPYVQIWDAGECDTGFYCECYFPHPVHRETLPLFEEKMRQIIKENRPIRTLEMVPVSASELFKKEGQLAQADFLEELEGNLVELIEIGPYHCLSEGPHLKATSELAAFKLIHIENIEDQGIRVEGACASSKGELKEFLKSLASYQETNHQIIGRKLALWYSSASGWVWFKKGLELRQALFNYFLTESQNVVVVECAGERSLLFSEISKGRPLDYKETIYSSQPIQNLYASDMRIQKTFFSPLESVISSLQSAHKSLMILGFHCLARVAGKRQGKSWKRVVEAIESRLEQIEKSEEREARVDLIAEDPLKRPIILFSLKKEGDLLICEAYIERILALLLEMNIGFLPKLLERPNQDVEH